MACEKLVSNLQEGEEGINRVVNIHNDGRSPSPKPGGVNALEMREFSSTTFECSLNSPLQQFGVLGSQVSQPHHDASCQVVLSCAVVETHQAASSHFKALLLSQEEASLLLNHLLSLLEDAAVIGGQ